MKFSIVLATIKQPSWKALLILDSNCFLRNKQIIVLFIYLFITFAFLNGKTFGKRVHDFMQNIY